MSSGGHDCGGSADVKLQQIANGTSSIPIENLGKDKALSIEIQTQLYHLGCLDPKPDGQFGAVSRLVLAMFARRSGLPYKDAVSPAIAKALLQSKTATFLPLKLGNDLGSRIVKYMALRRFWVARFPGFVNIVYLEGSDKNGRHNADRMDEWNDRRIIFQIDGAGRPVIKLNVEATTEPGRFYTDHPLNKMGAARIALEQFKSWHVGMHHANLKPPRKHEALVQAANITVFRDKNKDGFRTGDPTQVSSGLGINQHSGLNASASSIGKSSAGCLVARRDADHKKFMAQVKKDPRYLANNGYLFITTIIGGDDLDKKVP